MAGDLTRAAIHAQPDWLRQVPTDRRLPDGVRVVYTGCGTSFHAAQTGGDAIQALEAVLPPPDADLLVVVSHEGDTPVTLEAARAFRGPKWLVTGKADSPLGELCDEVVVATPEIEQSWCHTASYTCAVATLAALRGEDVSWLPDAVEAALGEREPVSEHERWLSRGPAATGRPRRRRSSSFARARTWRPSRTTPSSCSTATSPPSTRASAASCSRVRAARRSARTRAVEALRVLGCETTLVPTRHPVVDIVRFQLLTLDLAEARGVEPDRIRRDDERWARAADAATPPSRVAVAEPVHEAERLPVGVDRDALVVDEPGRRGRFAARSRSRGRSRDFDAFFGQATQRPVGRVRACA